MTAPISRQVLEAIQARGCVEEGLLYAAHEAAHALDLGLPKIAAVAIDATLMSLSCPRRLRAEITAHAVAYLVCERLGAPCPPIAASVAHATIGFVKAGDAPPSSAEFVRLIRDAMGTARVRDLADRVIALGAPAEECVSRQVRYQRAHAAKGLCRLCSRPRADGVLCAVHRAAKKAQDAARYRNRVRQEGARP